MKMKLLASPLMLALMLALAMSPLFAFAQEGTATAPPAAAKPEHKGHAMKAGKHKMMCEHRGEMKEGHEKAMAKMKEMDARMDEKVAAMNAATGDAKMSAMEAVINEMVTQRKEMREMMGAMHHRGGMCMCMGMDKGKCMEMCGHGGHKGRKGHKGHGMMHEHHGGKGMPPAPAGDEGANKGAM